MKSFLAIIAGLLTMFGLSAVTDTAASSMLTESFDENGMPRPTELIIVMLLYKAFFAILGGGVTSRMAAHHKREHALTMGSLGMLARLFHAVLNVGDAPLWFLLGSAVLVLPCVWLGSRWTEPEQSRERAYRRTLRHG